MFEVDMYYTESGRIPVADFIQDLQKKNQQLAVTRIKDYIDLLKEHGFDINRYKSQAIKKVDRNNDIWELRPGDNRVFFFHFTGNTFVLLHAYQQKSQELPPTELKQAVREMKDYKRRAKE